MPNKTLDFHEAFIPAIVDGRKLMTQRVVDADPSWTFFGKTTDTYPEGVLKAIFKAPDGWGTKFFAPSPSANCAPFQERTSKSALPASTAIGCRIRRKSRR